MSLWAIHEEDIDALLYLKVNVFVANIEACAAPNVDHSMPSWVWDLSCSVQRRSTDDSVAPALSQHFCELTMIPYRTGVRSWRLMELRRSFSLLSLFSTLCRMFSHTLFPPISRWGWHFCILVFLLLVSIVWPLLRCLLYVLIWCVSHWCWAQRYFFSSCRWVYASFEAVFCTYHLTAYYMSLSLRNSCCLWEGEEFMCARLHSTF